jgi:methionyl-tRNA formyltransferase
LVEELDAGPILIQKKIGIHGEDNLESLSRHSAVLGANLLLETIERLGTGKISPTPQEHSLATFAPPLKKEDGRLDWSRPAKILGNQVRGMNPWPGTFTFLREKRLKIFHAQPFSEAKKGIPGEIIHSDAEGLEIACGTGTLLVKELQLEGGKKLPVSDFLKGHPLSVGNKFG